LRVEKQKLGPIKYVLCWLSIMLADTIGYQEKCVPTTKCGTLNSL